MKNLFRTLRLFLLAFVLTHSWAQAQELDFRAPRSAADAGVPAVMRDLAVRILPVYQENNAERYLTNLSILQLVAGDYSSAYASRRSLRERRGNSDAGRISRSTVLDLYARAKAIEVESRVPFARAFSLSFRSVVPRLDDHDTYLLEGLLTTPLSSLQDVLQRAFDQRRSRSSLPLPDALDLLTTYLMFDAYRTIGNLAGPLLAAEDQRRYLFDDTIRVRISRDVSIAVVVVRPKTLERLPALLEFSIEAGLNDAKEAAAHGYVGVMAYARGVRGSTGDTAPFEHDGDDARAVIEWIAKQPWSDARVGLYGSGYSGFAAWATAKRVPAALKAIATMNPMVPGLTFPMPGNIFQNDSYRWLYRIMKADGEADELFEDDAKWRAYNQEWYTTGRSYREFVLPEGRHSALFGRWLGHPSFDRYWQKFIPTGEQFAKLAIPVLTMTGYFSGAEPGALHYFSEHRRHNEKADHTLLIGPYEESGAHGSAPPAALRGYTLDAAALVDLRELRFQWFDQVLRGAKKPALLSEPVNYQAMATNEWRHVASLDAMSSGSLRLFLEANPTGDRNQLVREKGSEAGFLPQTFDLADRTNTEWPVPAELAGRSLTVANGESFVSEPLPQPMEVSGMLSGLLDFRVNRMDMDISLSLYELLPNGEYVRLFAPTYETRASYIRDRSHRRLLKSGVRQQLEFQAERLTSRRVGAGSRIVLVLGIVKRPDQQINYGSGDDVSVETIENARVPLRIRWYGSSYIDLPLRAGAK